MFSFVKELDENSAALLKSLEKRQDHLWRKYRVRLYVFWIGDDPKCAKAWLKENKIKRIPFSRFTDTEAKLRAWNLDPEARSTGVLASRKKEFMATFPDFSAKQLETVEKTLADLLEARK